ncbi:MAG: hypothetical protein ACAF41_14765 [Leptolyngbya sp. BL-A-14]
MTILGDRGVLKLYKRSLGGGILGVKKDFWAELYGFSNIWVVQR